MNSESGTEQSLHKQLWSLRDQLTQFRFRFSNEKELQAGIRLALRWEEHTTEVVLSKRDRIDFLLDNGIGVEVKVAGSLSAVTAQVLRYTQSDLVSAVLVITTKTTHRKIPNTLNGKPVDVLQVASI